MITFAQDYSGEVYRCTDYVDACETLDAIQPRYAVRGFVARYYKIEGRSAVTVRHAAEFESIDVDGVGEY